MPTLNFPSNPIVGQTYDFGAFRYRYDGEKWTTIATNDQTINQAMDAHKSGLDQHTIGGVQGLPDAMTGLQDRLTELEGWPQHGSNANGNWVKHRDGTLHAYHTITQAGISGGSQISSGVWATNWGGWIYPEAFIGVACLSATVTKMPSIYCWASAGDGIAPTESARIIVYTPTQLLSSASVTVSLSAIGRWK